MTLQDLALRVRERDTDAVTSVPERQARRQLRADLVRVLAVFLAFAAFAVLSWESFGSWEGPSFFYPAAGITVAAMMLSRRRLWPWIAVAVSVAEILVDTLYGSPLWISIGFAAANVLEPLIGATLVLAWCGGPPDLLRRRDFVGFVAGACMTAPIFSGLIGGAAIYLHYGTPWLSAAVTWWAGDALGVLVMASPILLWRTQSQVVRKRPWEMAGVLVLTAGLSVATFWTDLPPSIFILPVLAWAAFRLNMLGAAIAGAVAAFLANIMTTHGRGLFIHMGVSPAAQVGLTQMYVAVIVVVTLLIAQEGAARRNAVQDREAERRERMRLETLSRLAHQLSAALTPEDIGKALDEQVLNEAGATAFIFGLLSPDGATLKWVAMSGYPRHLLELLGSGMPMSEPAVVTDVIRSGEPMQIHTESEFVARYPERAALLRHFDARSGIGLPLSAGGKPFGAVLLAWSEPQPFDEAQMAYISAVSTMVSQALVRARVYADEHARAAVLHSVAQPVAKVEADGLEYCALYEPAAAAHGLGGDWFSVMTLPERRTYLAVGDVVGHGLFPVEDMAQLRIAGNAYAHMGLGPARMLGELNRYTGDQTAGEFATSLVAVYDPARGTLTYGSAGHLPALLRRSATGEVVRLSNAQGPILGPFEDSTYAEATVSVESGDVLIMYTDGLVEHYGEDLHAGIGHLESVIAAWPPEALLDCEALCDAVAPAPRSDDVCLLAVRFGHTA